MKAPKLYPPNPDFSKNAHVPSERTLEMFKETASCQSDLFWTELAKALDWEKPFHTVHSWKMPVAKWFEGGKINLAYNCIDRHLKKKARKTAIVWEGEVTKLQGGESFPTELRRLSYQDLHDLTCQIANTLKNLGVKKGDRVAIYLPMVPEIVATMQACARIGAIHTVVFAGFSAQSLADRLSDSQAKVLVTADGGYRKGKFLNLKTIADEAVKNSSVQKVLVYERLGKNNSLTNRGAKDVLWSESVEKAEKHCDPVWLDSEDPLFILYTSGTTGKPKGLFHTQAGYLLWTHWTTRWLFDLKDDDMFWCTADCGWITGHSYLTYGPLSNGASLFMYEGAPLFPDHTRFWQMIERHEVSILYTSPTAIRTFMRFSEDDVLKNDLSSLRVLGSVGEPINPEAWEWYHRVVGQNRCPVIDTWWQTETGGAMIAPLPGASTLKPGSALQALPGIDAQIIDIDTGLPVGPGTKGALVIEKPWPGMARGIWGDMPRYESTYWNKSPKLKGLYVTGDLAERDDDGDFWIEGRMDDVLNVSGHRLGTAEVESALVEHPSINEAAVVGVPDPIKGQGIVAFVTLKEEALLEIERGDLRPKDLQKEAINHVSKSLGAFAKPDSVRIAKQLPKTRSGKIMRRLLRELATTGKVTGDTSTLEDFSAESALGQED